MKKKDASFWSDIKALDERLAREPDSFCFARLSEIYLKVGLIADALHTARTGVAKHPGYLAGQRALAMACNASDLHDESRRILEQVTSAMPEDVEAQKALAGLHVAAGDTSSAIRTYRTVLDFRPDDKASVLELEALQHVDTAISSDDATTAQIEMEPAEVDDEIVKDEIIELSESDIIELSESDIIEEQSEEVCVETPTSAVSGGGSDHHDPLSTLTLAELYEQQGFLPKALEIYRTILADDPENALLLAKVARLEGHESFSDALPEDAAADDFDEEPDLYAPVASDEAPVAIDEAPVAFEEAPVAFEEAPVAFEEAPVAFEEAPVAFEEAPVAFEEAPVAFEEAPVAFEEAPVAFEEAPVAFDEAPVSFEEAPVAIDEAPVAFEGSLEAQESQFIEPEFAPFGAREDTSASLESGAFAPLAHQTADNVVDTLDTWLENIRRIKACR